MNLFNALIDVFAAIANLEEETDPLLSNKIVSSEKITLVEGNEIIRANKKTSKGVTNLLANIVKKLDVPQHN